MFISKSSKKITFSFRPERKSNFFGRLGYEHKDENEWNKFEDILVYLDKIIRSGKIRYIGLSNETAWGLSKFLEISKLKKLPRIMSVQNPYSYKDFELT